MGRFARLLNKPDDANYFENLAAQMKKFARQRDDLEKQLERESHIAPIKIQEEK